LLFSAAEGARSLKDRENKEIAFAKADQDSSNSRFSSLRQASIKFNSSQEANAMVLAKWAADENLLVASTEGSGVTEKPGRVQNATPVNKTGMLQC